MSAVTAPVLDPGSRLDAVRRILGLGGARRIPFMIWIALGFLGAVIFLSLFGRLVFNGSPGTQHLLENGDGPTSAHWLGTDGLGRDVFSRMVEGSKTALLGPFIIAFSGLVVSSLVGIAAGYFGGVIDLVISRVVDFMFALPGLLIAIVVVSVVGGGYPLAIAVLCVLNVQGDIRIVRSVAVKQRALPYIEAARTLGVPRWRIMYQHIFLNIIPILIANLALDFGGALIALAGLAFLGLGSPAGSPEWGRMLAEGQSLLFQNPSAALAPGLAIVLLAMSVSLIGDWVYDGYSRRGRSER
jgi:peptide/nickel transport system permease protein